jgi:hypothetical protein
MIVAFVVLLVLDLLGVMWVVAFGGLGLAFAVVGHGGMWLPSVIGGVIVDAILIWLTVVVGKRLSVW